MKLRGGMALCALFWIMTQAARAGDADVTITSTPKHLEDAAATGAGGKEQYELKKSETMGYEITVENLTFKPIEKVEVKYIVFYKQEKLGQKGPAVKAHKSGSAPLDAIAPHAKESVQTTGVVLTKSALLGDPGSYMYFPNGAKPKAADSLTGIWVRIYKDGNVFAEYANPPSIAEHEQWQ